MNFLTKLGKSVSSEVRLMRTIVATDVPSITGKNCLNMEKEFKLDPWTRSAHLLRCTQCMRFPSKTFRELPSSYLFSERSMNWMLLGKTLTPTRDSLSHSDPRECDQFVSSCVSRHTHYPISIYLSRRRSHK